MATVAAIRTVELGQRTLVIAATGEVDMVAAPELESALAAASAQGAELVVVDLRAATLLDSRALGVLLAFARRLSGAGRALVVVADDPRVRRLFEITGLDRVFTVERSLQEALDRDGRRALA